MNAWQLQWRHQCMRVWPQHPKSVVQHEIRLLSTCWLNFIRTVWFPGGCNQNEPAWLSLKSIWVEFGPWKFCGQLWLRLNFIRTVRFPGGCMYNQKEPAWLSLKYNYLSRVWALEVLWSIMASFYMHVVDNNNKYRNMWQRETHVEELRHRPVKWLKMQTLQDYPPKLKGGSKPL